ncbi:UNVERIFIED_CONTAM: Arogenate dehydratase/prephenate dehydratase 6, chloroplastic [Sesamum radiatum]|uniref:Arogenate dehydratase/prephenate dehydratase 6, chloroplastic n=1 Tax=Sesamum radiatum TaxID=300843 RepID=A0AAW2W3C0_SESRA
MGLNVAREAVDDTAGAAEYIATNNLRDTAAIASARAAELYGLQILADGIQDDSGNVTRCVGVRFPEHQPDEDRVPAAQNRPIRLVDDANVGTAKHFEYMFYVFRGVDWRRSGLRTRWRRFRSSPPF